MQLHERKHRQTFALNPFPVKYISRISPNNRKKWVINLRCQTPFITLFKAVAEAQSYKLQKILKLFCCRRLSYLNI